MDFERPPVTDEIQRVVVVGMILSAVAQRVMEDGFPAASLAERRAAVAAHLTTNPGLGEWLGIQPPFSIEP